MECQAYVTQYLQKDMGLYVVMGPVVLAEHNNIP